MPGHHRIAINGFGRLGKEKPLFNITVENIRIKDIRQIKMKECTLFECAEIDCNDYPECAMCEYYRRINDNEK